MAGKSRAGRARRKSTFSSKNGSTLFGVLLGLILGLAGAAVVAYFVTQVPMPFADKASRTPPQTLLPDVRHAPDPNLGLAGNSTPMPATAPAGPPARPSVQPMTSITPVPPHTPSRTPPKNSPTQPDDIDALLATLGSAQRTATAPQQLPAVPSAASRQNATIYFLQAGAFRSENDAQSTRARVLLLGLPAQVQTAQLDGAPLYRVRVGPFKGIDEMNRSREQLSRAQIESAIIRP